MGDGGSCSGEAREQINCSTSGCPIDCRWGSWSLYSSCSRSCGGGTQRRTRSKTVNERNGGLCSGQSSETIDCNKNGCPVNCQWGSWGSYGGCSRTCKGGTKCKYRQKTVNEADGGSCSGSFSYCKSCNT